MVTWQLVHGKALKAMVKMYDKSNIIDKENNFQSSINYMQDMTVKMKLKERKKRKYADTNSS